MSTSKREPAEVVEESISHFRAQKLDSGSVRLKFGGSVVVADSFYKALERYAKWQQEEIENSPEHLRQDKVGSVCFETVHPESFTEYGVPVVYGIDAESGEKRLLRVCDTMDNAETVKEAYEEGGSMNLVFDLDEVKIERVQHGPSV